MQHCLRHNQRAEGKLTSPFVQLSTIKNYFQTPTNQPTVICHHLLVFRLDEKQHLSSVRNCQWAEVQHCERGGEFGQIQLDLVSFLFVSQLDLVSKLNVPLAGLQHCQQARLQHRQWAGRKPIHVNTLTTQLTQPMWHRIQLSNQWSINIIFGPDQVCNTMYEEVAFYEAF